MSEADLLKAGKRWTITDTIGLIMNRENTISQELHHEIFGSILDRDEMTPYLLLRVKDYETALRQAAKMMGNRGFDLQGEEELGASEKMRASQYIEQAFRYSFQFLLPSVRKQLTSLLALQSPNEGLYKECIHAIDAIKDVMNDGRFREVVLDDPRHLFLLAASKKYPHVFRGYRGGDMEVTAEWQKTACSILKVAYLIKSIEEDSQDINDYSQLGMFLEMEGRSLNDLFNYEWERPAHLPGTEPAQRAFVKIGTFFLKLKESLDVDRDRGCLIFNSGDGVSVDIVRIESRLKSPESMFTKLGKSVEGEAHSIRDVLAITFILKKMEDTLMLVHALQKRGVILQENTVSPTITQTLFERPEDMAGAVKNLILSLSKSEGSTAPVSDEDLAAYAEQFYESLSMNAQINPHSSLGHKKFQCKLNFSIPIHREAGTNKILIPGTPQYMERAEVEKRTEQHTLSVELRISDEQSWSESEQKGDSHHQAYKFRQLVSVMNRLFRRSFQLPEERFGQLREDQKRLFV